MGMIDMEAYHRECNQISFETYALVEYFQLLKQIELAGKDGYPIFKLIGGNKTLTALEIRVKDGYFDCTKSNQELFNSLFGKVEHLKIGTQTYFVEEAISNGETIEKFMKPSEDIQDEDALTTLTRLFQDYPTEVVAPFLTKLKNGSLEKPKKKTIGQR
ncbi:MAG: hypothetical protein K2I72_00075 [Bacilli bacterium]|nr:hypothetical protein [Bacilli bacterium]